MNRSRATVALLLAGLLLGFTTACSGPSADDPAPSGSEVSLPHKGKPIPGVLAAELISTARTALPSSLQEDTRSVGAGYVTWTHTEIGYPGEHDRDFITTNAPAITIFWEDDGAVILVGCGDMVNAGLSPAMEVCTDLSITGVPAGGLRSNFSAYPDKPWEMAQPFPQIVLTGFDYPAAPPKTGTARSFSVTGPDPPSIEPTNTSSL